MKDKFSEVLEAGCFCGWLFYWSGRESAIEHVLY